MGAVSAPVRLPPVLLQGKRVAQSVLEIIPLSTAERFQVVAYEQDEHEIKLAVVHPEQLKQGFYEALEHIGSKIGKKITLAHTDATGFQEIINQYKSYTKQEKKKKPTAIPTVTGLPPMPANPSVAKTSTGPAPTPASLFPSVPQIAVTPPQAPGAVVANLNHSGWGEPVKPPLFELGKLVAFNYLRRVPYEFAEKERLLSVDFLRPNIYWFVTDGSNDSRLKKAIQYISENNHIVVHVLPVKKEDFNSLLAYYQHYSDQIKDNEEEENANLDIEKKEEEKKAIERKLEELSRPVDDEDSGPKRIAKDVIMPGIQAQIISTEEEKKGLAGFVQRLTQNFAAQESEKKLETMPYTPPKELEITPAVVAKPVVTPPVAAVVVAPPPVGASVTIPGAALPTPPTPSAQPAPPVAAPPAQAATPPATPAPTAETKPAPRSINDDSDDIGKLLDKQINDLDELKAIIRLGIVPRIVAAVVSFAIHEKASDIHIESYDDEVRVRYRIDGQLIDIVKLPPDIHNPMVSRIKILSKLRLDENRVPQDGRFDVNFDETTQVDVRISIMPTVHGEKVVMRILDKSRGITSLEGLGLEGVAYEWLTQAIQKPYGICLATGPTGSGKSTSLYAILSRIATPNVNVVTLEDPIEYEMKGINQSQIRPKIGYTFAEGLRSILRQDPNIIMVGEIRDGETATMATQAALTGHLVLSTLHTNDAAGAIPRLTNMGIEPFLITSSLNVVMAQRLVRKICPNCRREVSLPQGIRSQFERDIEEIAALNPTDAKRIKRPITFYQGSGCDQCSGKGYQGRVGIYEVLLMNDEMADLTVEHASSAKIQEAARRKGMLTLYQDGLLKATAGITTIDEVLRESSNK